MNFVQGINHVTLSVKNIDVSFGFYTSVLGLKPLVKWDKGAYLLAGDFWFCLNVESKISFREDNSHFAFTVSSKDFEALSERILNAKATLYKKNTSPGDSIYFLDPDGHKLEIHTGDWQTRLLVKKENPGSWKQIQWF